jgi:ribose transport system ATP-binding protein
MASSSNPPAGDALALRGIGKRFGATQALDDVSLTFRPGEVHALVGGNGSGKSTLIKILAGVVIADVGQIDVGGERYDARDFTPARARAAGLRFVHQQSSTFAQLTVAENLAIGHGFDRGGAGRIRWRRQEETAREILDRFQIDADPRQAVGSLNAAKRTTIAIARALQDRDDADAGILVLDEPTASLPAAEVELLLTDLRRFAAEGQTILYVSHRLEEILTVADTASVLRDGRTVSSMPREELSLDGLAEAIMGRPIEQIVPPAVRSSGGVVLEARDIRGGAVQDATFSLRQGEVVGVAGLLGSGRSTLLRLLFGAEPIEAGELLLDGEPVSFSSPSEAMDAGMGYVPEDRSSEAAFPQLTVTENLSICVLPSYWRGGRLRHRQEHADARDLQREYLIRSASERSPLASLSGGNQQKVILARWMRRQPRVLLLDEPTQGVDVGARAEIYGLIRKVVEAGATVLVVSSDLEELAGLCDRVLIVRNGRLLADLDGAQVTDVELNHRIATTEPVST